jgi:hypothetical protein
LITAYCSNSIYAIDQSSNTLAGVASEANQYADRSLSYRDDLAESGVEGAAISKSSAVIEVDDCWQLAHIVGNNLPSTQVTDGVKSPATNKIYIEAAGFLAIDHFNPRSGQVLPFCLIDLRIATCLNEVFFVLPHSSITPSLHGSIHCNIPASFDFG